MNTFSIFTLGCKVNQYESQQIRELLEKLSLRQVPLEKKPDLVVVNTCCVTRSASAKSRRFISKMKKHAPDANIVVAGCLPTVDINELNIESKNTHIVKHRHHLASALTQIVDREEVTTGQKNPHTLQSNCIKPENKTKIKPKTASHNCDLPALKSFTGQTRAFLKVQDGCDGRCAYCIVPQTRPNVHSKDPDEIINEAKNLVAAGRKEIVVTGVFLGAYGKSTVRRKKWDSPNNPILPDLIEKLALVPNLHRIRLSSLEPADVTEQLLEVFAKYPNIMPHLHLSVQSGSADILRKMCRQYSPDQVIEKIDLAKKFLDTPAITTDFIVGFPGETDSDFNDSVNLAARAGFAKMHVFPFSLRKGTPAAKLTGRISHDIIKLRAEKLRRLSDKLAYDFRQKFVGRTVNILTESRNNQTIGRSRHYFQVTIDNPTPDIRPNQILDVLITQNNTSSSAGQIQTNITTHPQ